MIATNLDEQQVIPAEDLAKAALWMYQQPQILECAAPINYLGVVIGIITPVFSYQKWPDFLAMKPAFPHHNL